MKKHFFIILFGICINTIFKTSLCSSLELYASIDLHMENVDFFSEENLINCRVSKNDEEIKDSVIEFHWKKSRGVFNISEPGTYKMTCNKENEENTVVEDTIIIPAELFKTRRSKINLPSVQGNEGFMSRKLPEEGDTMNVRVRSAENRERFAAFYEQPPLLTNASREETLTFVNNLVQQGTDLHDIYIEPLLKMLEPSFYHNGTHLIDLSKNPLLHQSDEKVPLENRTFEPSSFGDNQTPLLDGGMGWMKAFNFSAKRRICGAGARVHFYDDGYHTQHEDLKNPNIHLRSQKNGCTDYSRVCDHGTSSLGILGAVKNNFGIEGLSRCADEINIYSYGHSITDAMNYARPGDIYGVNVQFCLEVPDCKRMFPYTCTYPNEVITFAKSNIIVVQAAGNAHLNLNEFDRCKNQQGPGYGFVVSATLRDSIYKRNMGLSDNGIGWFTNYNHDNSIVNGWGNNVLTTTSQTGGELFLGRDRGYDLFSGTSSATPLTTAAVTVIQGYFRSMCPDKYLSFTSLEEIFKATGNRQQVPYKMGYAINIEAAIQYINKNFLPRCDNALEKPPLEEYVNSYDSLIDPWTIVENVQNRPQCRDHNVKLEKNINYLTENLILRYIETGLKNLVICQKDGQWISDSFYLPMLSENTVKKLNGVTLSFVRESGYSFNVYKSFGVGAWQLQRGQYVKFIINSDNDQPNEGNLKCTPKKIKYKTQIY